MKTTDRPSLSTDTASADITDLSALIDFEKIDRNLTLIRDLDLQKSVIESQIKTLREEILLQLQLLKTDKLEATQAKISRYSTTKVKVSIDPTDLPQRFQTIAADTKGLRSAMEAGVEVDGCSLESNESIRINWRAD